MKVFCLILVVIFMLFHSRCSANAQGLQQLSYVNADLGERLIRSTTPTTLLPISTTTPKQGLFSGIRNIFSRTTTTLLPRIFNHEQAINSITSTPKLSTNGVPNNTVTKLPALISPVANINIISTTEQTASSIRDIYPSTISHSSSIPSFPIALNKTFHEIPTIAGQNYRHSATHDSPKAITDRMSVTDDELLEISEELFRKEMENNLYNQIQINYQGRTYSSAVSDEAAEPLLMLNKSILDTVPTISKMRLLFNNYELDAAINEHVTPIERNEETDLADALLTTPLMRRAMLFLKAKGKVTADVRSHRDLLKLIWFKLYSRGNGKIGSSGFEHVFLAELKKGNISGLHNWIYFYEEELAGHINYMGYMKKVQLGDKGAIVKLRLSYNGHMKPSNTIFIGTSPELEIALYTLCFELRPDTSCPVSLNGKQINIRTYTFRYRGNNLIGSAFAEI